MSQTQTEKTEALQNLLEDVLKKAKQLGADAADAMAYDAVSLSVAKRHGKTEKLERSEENDLGLRVLIGQKQAIVSTSDKSKEALETLIERAVSMAKSVPDDPYAGLADPSQLAEAYQAIEACDTQEPTAEELGESARRAEEAALSHDGITNSEGGEASYSRTSIALAATNGFTGSYETSRHAVVASVLAGAGAKMERDYAYSYKVFAEDLKTPEAVGHEAAERTLKRLNPTSLPSGKMPVIFSDRVSSSLLGHYLSAVNGASIARGTSFLKEALGTQVLSEDITITENPYLARGLRSRSFDVEGLRPEATELVSRGKLNQWILDLRTARQLGLQSNAHASRGVSSSPSPSVSNCWIEPGKQSVEEMIASLKDGLYITEMMGSAVSIITGDYSRGAAGFRIRDGKIAEPVSEITVASNLKEMFLSMIPADDLELKSGVDAPSLLIPKMMIAGS